MSRTTGQVRSSTSGSWRERARAIAAADLKLVTRPSPRSARSVLDLRHDEAAAAGVEVEELGIAAPVDGRLELAQRLFLAELLVEHVEEELLGHGVVALGLERARDLAQQQHILDRGVAE